MSLRVCLLRGSSVSSSSGTGSVNKPLRMHLFGILFLSTILTRSVFESAS